MSSSSFKSNPQMVHDVFLSFRGEDTRSNIVSYLYSSLSNAGINTFLDDKLVKGRRLYQELWRAIEGSKISIVVFSKNYADSTWCLDELEKIMECHRNIGQLVIPIFYYVDPSDVRKQKGSYGEALARLEAMYSRMTDELVRWTRALTEAATLAGWDVRNSRSESQLVTDVVDFVLTNLNNTLLSITDFPVGLESRVHDVTQFLEQQPNTVSIVGIWGMGGLGKTTIAKAIYNKIHREYGDRCFLENIREVCEKDKGQIPLQEQLLSDILKIKVKIHSIAMGTTMIEQRLCGKRALIVLDDVTKFEQLKALCGNRKWIGQGSVIIITTRDVRLLKVLKVDYVYKVEEMDENESLELFSWHAFREARPREGFIELSRNVVAYCGGLPLALEVLGAYLFERTEQEWESVLSKLETIPNDQVQEKLRISFDGLRDQMENDIFLDICCFFIGKDRAYVTDILNGCGLHADIGITVLIERSLIKIEKNNKLGMHDLLRDMGREIVRESSIKKPEKRSRLWFHEDVLDVLTKNTGTEAIEGLALKLPDSSRDCFNASTFDEMKRLRLLQLDQVQLTGDYACLSKQLRWVFWKGFPLKSIPDNFYQGNVVVIDLKHSNIKLVWKQPQLLKWLKILNLSHSKYLTITPDFSNIPNLEKLILKDCPSLCKVHHSIGDLCKILLINLKDCTSLRNLPSVTYKLKSVKTFILSGCSKIDKLEEDIVQMESLTTLIAENTAVKQVPFSIVRSKSIGYISLCEYAGFTRDVFPLLIWSWMSPTTDPFSCIQPFGVMSSSVVSINLQNNYFKDLSPMLSSLSKLRSVWVQCDTEIQLSIELRTILNHVYDVNCFDLETSSTSQISKHSLRSYLIGMGSYQEVFNTLSKSISEGLTTDESCNVILPGNNYPYWLAHTGEGHSVFFIVPQDNHCRMKGMTICVVYSSPPENTAAECFVSILIANFTKCTIQIYKRDTAISFNDEDWQGMVSNLGSGDKVEIFVVFQHGLVVRKTALYLMYDESIDVEMEHCPKPKKNAFVGFIKKFVSCMTQSD